MRVERRDGYRLVIGGPVPPQAAAITLGNTVIVRKRLAGDRALLAHELVHVRQFRELGALRFLVKYVGSYLRFRLAGYGHMAAYRRIPLEVEASWESRLQPRPDAPDSAEPRSRRRRSVVAPGPARLRTAFRGPRRGARLGRPSRTVRRLDLDKVQAAMAVRPGPADDASGETAEF